jgi:hypothetical protein
MREVTSYGLDDRVVLLAGAGNVLFIVVSRLAVGPTTGGNFARNNAARIVGLTTYNLVI